MSFCLSLLQTSPGGGLGGMLPLLIMLFAIMYIMVIRPQRKKEKQRLEMLSRVKKNDRVLTSGGIYGVVMNVKDDEVVLRIDEANNVRVKLSRGSIVGVIDKKDDEGSKE